MTDDHGLTYPEDGVAATRPAMEPEQKPTMLHRRSMRKSSRHQTMPPKAAAIMVFQTAKIARRLAPKALPPLKPIQPNHNIKAVGKVIDEYQKSIGAYRRIGETLLTSKTDQGDIVWSKVE